MENLTENLMKYRLLELREETAEAIINMMQRIGELKKRLKKKFMNEIEELLCNI